MLRNCCFNWKVWAGAGASLLVVLVVAPGALGAAVPIAIGLACPLSMAAMMWGMRSPRGSTTSTQLAPSARGERIAALEAEVRRLRGEPQGSSNDGRAPLLPDGRRHRRCGAEPARRGVTGTPRIRSVDSGDRWVFDGAVTHFAAEDWEARSAHHDR